MNVYIANSLYDVVFKHLMEDELNAKTVLSAVLQRDICNLKIYQKGYRNIKSGSISMFKMSFVANIKVNENKSELTNIKLYKTWVDTDNLQHRQHIALPYYMKEENSEFGKDETIPTISIYLLAHRVDDIAEPLAYTSPNHLIIQMPLISKNANSYQNKVLSIFDQSNACKEDKHILKVDYLQYDGDHDMEHMITTLLSDATNPEMRNQMNLEDEFISLLETKDTQIMQQMYLIEQTNKLLKTP